jgi:hypothetical protein
MMGYCLPSRAEKISEAYGDGDHNVVMDSFAFDYQA